MHFRKSTHSTSIFSFMVIALSGFEASGCTPPWPPPSIYERCFYSSFLYGRARGKRPQSSQLLKVWSPPELHACKALSMCSIFLLG